jgi:hypothetical protein
MSLDVETILGKIVNYPPQWPLGTNNAIEEQVDHECDKLDRTIASASDFQEAHQARVEETNTLIVAKNRILALAEEKKRLQRNVTCSMDKCNLTKDR